jgi:hypothetical protein
LPQVDPFLREAVQDEPRIGRVLEHGRERSDQFRIHVDVSGKQSVRRVTVVSGRAFRLLLILGRGFEADQRSQ